MSMENEMSCNSSIAVVRMPFKDTISMEDIVRILTPIELSLTVDEYEGTIDYISVDESKAKFRPKKINKRWYLDRIISYEYEDNGDMDISINKIELDAYIKELSNIEGIDGAWGITAHVWYHGSDEIEYNVYKKEWNNETNKKNR